ncbi:triose-phosphate isomerase [archaeon SCG-AAA382B04]|nr:triose-phosphate isomerase [archaeon SCG-AAA382B04]
MNPKLIINFKTYKQATGQKAIKIAKKADKIDSEVDIILCPQPTNIKEIYTKTDLNIYSQHIDPIKPGSNTGHILPLSIKKAGATGTLLNHSEKNMTLKKIENANQLAKKHGLKTVICANNIKTIKAASNLNPDYVAIEPPELIGGDVSVTSADPQIITEAVEVSEVPVLCGAGVSNNEDFQKALELGAKGVLVASAITKSKKPKKAIKKIIGEN